MFTFENTTIICRLIDGKYPNYDAVIPKKNPNKLTISRSKILESINSYLFMQIKQLIKSS